MSSGYMYTGSIPIFLSIEMYFINNIICCSDSDNGRLKTGVNMEPMHIEEGTDMQGTEGAYGLA